MEWTSLSFDEKIRRDREAVFEHLYEAVFPGVARFVRRQGGAPDDARDVFHDALIILYEKAVAGKLSLDGAPEAYLTGIARHLWYRRRRDAPALVELEPGIADNIEAEADPPPSRRHLLRFLEAAGRRCMDLLQAFYYQRLSMREIAQEFGFAGERSATVQKYKCLEKVRSHVKSQSYEETAA